MNDVVTVEPRGKVALIVVNHPPLNVFSHAVRMQLSDALRETIDNTAVQCMVLTGAGRSFMAGGDIREFDQPQRHPHLGVVADAIEASPKPVVAAIHGTALGGGFEIALASHYRVAVASAKIGLPEVRLGVIPGAGGTQRLTRLIGVAAAIDLIISGRHVTAPEALSLGALDEIAEHDLIDAATAAAIRLANSRTLRRTSHRVIEPTPQTMEPIKAGRAAIASRHGGQQASLAALDAIEAAVTLPYSQGSEIERALAETLRASPESAELRHLFFARRDRQR